MRYKNRILYFENTELNIERINNYLRLISRCRIDKISDLFEYNFIQEKKHLRNILKLLRKNNYPIEYLLKRTFFYDSFFFVKKGCFIPRNETEILIEKTDELLGDIFRNRRNFDIMEMCCGTGALGLTAAKLFNANKLTLVDKHRRALDVCKVNSNKFDNTELIKSNLFKKVPIKRFNLIFMNPPYVQVNEVQNLKKLMHEPKTAIYVGNNLKYYKEFIMAVKPYLKRWFTLVFEISNFINIETLTTLVNSYLPSDSKVKVFKDYDKNRRVFMVTNEI